MSGKANSSRSSGGKESQQNGRPPTAPSHTAVGSAKQLGRPATANVVTTSTGKPSTSSILPSVLDILAIPPPASTSGLLSSTSTLAATAGMTHPSGRSSSHDNENANSDTMGMNMHAEPFRSIMDNYGGWSRVKASARAFVADSSIVAGAAGHALSSTHDEDENEPTVASVQHNHPHSSTNHKTDHHVRALPHDPLFDQPYPPGCEHDPVLRAMLRIQRARVLSAAHTQATARRTISTLNLSTSPNNNTSTNHSSHHSRATHDPSTTHQVSSLGYSVVDLDPNILVDSTSRMLGIGKSNSKELFLTSASSRPATASGTTRASQTGLLQSMNPQDLGMWRAQSILEDDPLLGSRALSHAIVAGVIPSTLDMTVAREAYAKAHNERIKSARRTKDSINAKITEELRRAAERESRVKNRADFNARQRQLVTLIFTMRSAVAINMTLNDEKAKRAEIARRIRAAHKLCNWWKRILQYRYLKSLQESRRLIKRTMGRYVLRWRTLRYARAARVVATFLLATQGMNKQVRTMLAYRDYNRALKRVKAYLQALKKSADAQVRVVQMIWGKLENARRKDMARSICDALKGGSSGVSAAAPQLVHIMRLLHITTMGDAAARAAEIDRMEKHQNPLLEKVTKEAELRAHHGEVDVIRNSGATAFDIAGMANVSRNDGERGTVNLGSTSLSLDTTHIDNNALPHNQRRHSIDVVETCLQSVPDYIKVPAIRNFLKYRRRENFDNVLAYRKKMLILRPFFEKQRKALELIQRLQWRGPPSMFIFDNSQLKLPPPPKPFRNIPSDDEILTLIDRVSLEFYTEQSKIIRRSQSEKAAHEAAEKAAHEAEAERKAKARRHPPNTKGAPTTVVPSNHRGRK